MKLEEGTSSILSAVAQVILVPLAGGRRNMTLAIRTFGGPADWALKLAGRCTGNGLCKMGQKCLNSIIIGYTNDRCDWFNR